MFCNPQSQNQPMPTACGFNGPAQSAMNSFNMPQNQRPAQGNTCMQVNPMGNGGVPMAPTQNVNPYGMNPMSPMGNTNMGGMGSPYGNLQPVPVDVSRPQQPQQQQQNQWQQPQQQMYGMNNQQQLPALGFNNPMNNNNNTCMQCSYQQPQQPQQQQQNTYRPH